MEYHVHHQGKKLGVLSLEELRQRRLSGEFTGAELVWTQGMHNWQPLDAVLQTGGVPSAGPPPIPTPARSRPSARPVLWVVAAVVGFVVIGATIVGTIGVKFVKQARLAQQQSLGSHEAVEV